MLRSVVLIMLISLALGLVRCSDNHHEYPSEITVKISVTDDITVDGDTVAIGDLTEKLKEMGIRKETNIRVVPDPEAGAATVEAVQRTVRVAKNASDK